MTEDSTVLIQRILDGEEEAFRALVRKYQKRIHAIVFQKLGDYHIAEEITQDVFLQVHKKLSTLKNHECFDGWLYVIVNRLCINWSNRNKSTVQSIEDTPMEEIEESVYQQHESDQRDMETTELYRDIVRKLLNRLPESERTVLNLYYIAEMNQDEISKFLGVSTNTIHSRLIRARNRLKKSKVVLNTEFIRSVQLSTDLTDSIMRRIPDIKPTPPPAKPKLPWAALGTTAVVVLLLLGSMNQYFTHFQKPYDYAALSEHTIEIVESPIHIEHVSKPTLQRSIGRGVTNSQNEGVGTTVSKEDLASTFQDNAINSSDVPWTQVNGPQASPQARIFATSDNKVYAISRTSMYRLTEDGTSWMNINTSVPSNMYRSPLTEHQGIIYSVVTDEILASSDDGETWNQYCSRPNGDAVGLIINGKTQENSVMYLALRENGVFRSNDAGDNWIPLSHDFVGERITAVASVGNVVFIGTNQNLYRLNSGVWNQIPLDPLKTVHSMAVFDNNLYVVTGPDFLSSDYSKTNSSIDMSRKVFHSTDTGSTWQDITPEDDTFIERPAFLGTTVISAIDNTLFILSIPAFQSRDGGETWINRGIDMNLFPSRYSSVVAVNNDTFCKVGTSDILRTTDSGDTWHPFTEGIVKTKVLDMVAIKNRLYVYTGSGYFSSDENVSSWEDVTIDYGEFMPKIMTNNSQFANYLTNSKMILANNVPYGIISQENELRIFRLSDHSDVFSMILMIPSSKLWVNSEESDDIDLSVFERKPKIGGFAVSGNTFYIEYMRKLFKLTADSTDAIYTGLTDTSIHIDVRYDRGSKIAVSAEVVFVGKRNGKLFQSIDSGKNWQDVTPNIRYRFTGIKDMVFVGSTIYVATDKGVITSQTGKDWQLLTDKAGENINIDRMAMANSGFYGAGTTGAYRLKSHGRWEQISEKIPDRVISLSASSDKLYIGTEKRGIFQISLQDDLSETRTAKLQTVR